MSIFKYELAEGEVDPLPEVIKSQFLIVDSVGAAIQVHLRNLRIDLSIDEFETFAHNVEQTQQKINESVSEELLALFELSSGEVCRIERSHDVFHVTVDRTRVEMSTPEFHCFARVIKEARQSLQQEKQKERRHLIYREKGE